MEQHNLSMGLGDAVKRLMRVEFLAQRGLGVPENVKTERQMLVEALNTHKLKLGFACEPLEDDLQKDIGIFEQSASTSCCRLAPVKSSRRKAKK